MTHTILVDNFLSVFRESDDDHRNISNSTAVSKPTPSSSTPDTFQQQTIDNSTNVSNATSHFFSSTNFPDMLSKVLDYSQEQTIDNSTNVSNATSNLSSSTNFPDMLSKVLDYSQEQIINNSTNVSNATSNLSSSTNFPDMLSTTPDTFQQQTIDNSTNVSNATSHFFSSNNNPSSTISDLFNSTFSSPQEMDQGENSNTLVFVGYPLVAAFVLFCIGAICYYINKEPQLRSQSNNERLNKSSDESELIPEIDLDCSTSANQQAEPSTSEPSKDLQKVSYSFYLPETVVEQNL